MPRSFRVPSNAHAVDAFSGRTFAPGETVSESDLTLKGKDEAAIAHDQRLIDEVLIEVPGKSSRSTGGDG